MRLLRAAVAALVLAACAAPQARREAPVAYAARTPAASLGLRHYAGEGERVVIVGSPGVSAAIFDLPGHGGLAPYLQRRGFDVWVVDWRAAPRNSDLNALAASLRVALEALPGGPRPYRVFAHGLGGVAAVLAAPANAAGYVFVAVPGHLKGPLDPVAAFAAREVGGEASLRELAGRYNGTQDRLLLDDVAWSYGVRPFTTASLAQLFAPVGPALQRDLAAAVRAGGWGDAFARNLAALQAPVRVFVAQTDALAPPWQTYETYRRAGATDKAYRFFSRVNGESREYGHLSVLAGDDAARELFPQYAGALED